MRPDTSLTLSRVQFVLALELEEGEGCDPVTPELLTDRYPGSGSARRRSHRPSGRPRARSESATHHASSALLASPTIWGLRRAVLILSRAALLASERRSLRRGRIGRPVSREVR